jgi:hypothetical protein
MIRKFYSLFLALCLLAWSSITPVQAGQGKQGFKEVPSKVVFQNLSIASASSDTAVKKFSDSAFKTSAYYFITAFLISSLNSISTLGGFVYHHPIYNTLSAQAP